MTSSYGTYRENRILWNWTFYLHMRYIFVCEGRKRLASFNDTKINFDDNEDIVKSP